MKQIIALAAISAVLAGCSSFPVGQYAPSDANRAALAQLGAQGKVSVADFTAAKPGVTGIQCRGAGQIKFPTGQTAEQYVTGALRKELTYSGLFAEKGSVRIAGNVQALDFNSNVGNAGWDFDVTVSNGAESFRVQYQHRVKTSWMADRACAAVAEQMVEATQAFTQRVLSDPKFTAWVKAS
ncbi:hypothetical protein [Pelomonas sp. KK5]|uniref:hypothetical protein n=1 Tax=Pelomonas sp. KK5 TaxID=1855730 RepID=UPI00097CBCAB|nr:hypothetical protein [Pelomonas sp. KK5]